MPNIQTAHEFNLEEYTALIKDICSTIENYIRTYSSGFNESFRSNPFSKLELYLNETVNYGRYNNTKNRLLFGGEVDYITLSIYDILAYLAVWRLFNVLNDVELVKLKREYPDFKFELDRNFGTKFIIRLRRKTASYDRDFEPIVSVKSFVETFDYIKRFQELYLLDDLYTRFKWFGYVDWFNSITDIDEYNSQLISDQMSKQQLSIVDLTDYAHDDSYALDSIMQYCTVCAKNDISGLKSYYLTNLFNKDINVVKKFTIDKLKDVMSFAYSIQYPILYNLRK